MYETGVTRDNGFGHLEENSNGIDEDFPDFRSTVETITGPAIHDLDVFMMSHPKWKFVEVSLFCDLILYC